jgi:AraC-like DNA-binding protein
LQRLSAFLVAATCALSMILAGHFGLSRARPGRAVLAAFCAAFALQTGLLLVQLLDPLALPPVLRATVGASIPPLVYLFVARGAGSSARPLGASDARHGLPAVWILLLFLSDTPAAEALIDVSMVLIEAGYALALLSLDRAQRAGGRLRRRLPLWAAGFLGVVALSDALIAAELSFGASLSSSWALRVAIGLILVVMLGLFLWAWRDPEWLSHAAGVVHEVSRQLQPSVPVSDADLEAAVALCRRLDGYLGSSQAYREFGLSLATVARRLMVSPRQLSEAVNRVHGRGFRTLINDWKVDAAARLLEDPAQAARPITDVMFDAGFQTKSSFNREFVLRKGVPPSEYRQGRRGSRATDATGG